MDLYHLFAALSGAKIDDRDPIELMPKEIGNITLMYRKKKVDIPKTVKNLFKDPSLICDNIDLYWENVKKNPKRYVIDLAKVFRTEIVYQ